ncbi:hypothetical protein [Pontiella agarivorans]|uniref:Uncharacterized protein n=1 Tax=Pontiella agarivorans TaxID=3038953 RepID=A0ABU5N0F7_9BACT|nr:hypothetical protein [Pontiella agarivorans]MDZ8119935.1 hypothetical protein [Pontiella agarivorans]
MKKLRIMGIAAAVVLGGTPVIAQQVNQWRGGETAENWTDKYKWKQNHTPNEGESAHFREPISVINVNSTVQLSHGMHLYGQELSLLGNGNINLWSQVPHQRTVNIPASGDGFASLTLHDNISINGRLALSAKGFGTSASKGSVTLRDRSNVTGELCIGKAGTGTGQVFLKDHSTYRITGLEIGTEAKSGGSAEIHILSGTVRIETQNDPFETFNADPSRRIILGSTGTVRFEYTMPVAHKKEAIKAMIKNNRLVAAPGCRLKTPIIQEKLVIVRAEDERNDSAVKTKKQLLAAIDRISAASTVASSGTQPQKLESLLKNMRSNSRNVAAAPAPTANSTPVPVPTAGGNSSLALIMQQKGVSAETPDDNTPATRSVAGYIAFVGAAMLILRRNPAVPETGEVAEQSSPQEKTKTLKTSKKKKRR